MFIARDKKQTHISVYNDSYKCFFEYILVNIFLKKKHTKCGFQKQNRHIRCIFRLFLNTLIFSVYVKHIRLNYSSTMHIGGRYTEYDEYLFIFNDIFNFKKHIISHFNLTKGS